MKITNFLMGCLAFVGVVVLTSGVYAQNVTQGNQGTGQGVRHGTGQGKAAGRPGDKIIRAVHRPIRGWQTSAGVLTGALRTAS